MHPAWPEALDGQRSSPPDPPPEITAFEMPEGAPAWGFEALDFSLERELPHIKSFVDRTSALALGAAKIALSQAGLRPATEPLSPKPSPSEGESNRAEIGCAYGTELGCLEAMAIFWHKVKTGNPKFAQPLPFTHGYANSPSSLLCIEYGLRGPAATFSGERLAGIEALLFAYDQIAAGSGEIILAGASESLVLPAYSHLLASGQLSRSGKWDDGIVPGEGAAMLVLESEESARSRKARIYAEIEGINFFPIDPRATSAPIQIATRPDETVVLVSTPNVHAGGGWQSPLWSPDMPAVAAKLYTGDMLAASPVLGVGAAAQALGYGYKNLPLLRGTMPGKLRYALATGYDPSGQLGVVMLKKYET